MGVGGGLIGIQHFPPHPPLLGDPHTEEIVIGDQTYTIRTYYPNEYYTGEVTVCCVRDGIGYLIIANVAEGSRITDPRDLLLPWLENMG